jgi:hypothetical protein
MDTETENKNSLTGAPPSVPCVHMQMLELVAAEEPIT